MEYNICRGLLGRGSWRHGDHRWKFSRLGGRSVRIENHLWWIEMKTRREMHGEREFSTQKLIDLHLAAGAGVNMPSVLHHNSWLLLLATASGPRRCLIMLESQPSRAILLSHLYFKMIGRVTGTEALPFAVQLKALMEQEARFQPELCSLCILESAHDNGLRMTAKLRDFEVKDLLSLTRFFGFSVETFSLAVSLLDRFLAVMKIQPKHLSCVGLCCFYIAVKTSEEENVPLANVLIRISQNRFTVSDMMRMEKIILEKLYWKVRAPTALHFLRLFHFHI
ncbi:hypothetical protein AOLI_G00119850 [Acnodon oligacanthus]